MSALVSPLLIESLAESAAGIDATFAKAGAEMGEALTLIGAHGSTLAEMAGTLTEGQMQKARDALAVVAEEMSETRAKFAVETTLLMRLVDRSQEVGELFDSLRRNMRVVTIVTRSTRIEGASVRQASADFGDFTNEIVQLTTQASETLETCLRDQALLSSSLNDTLAAQREFERRFSLSLSSLAERITQSLANVTQTRSRDAEIVTRLKDRSGRLTRATGNAVVSMQCGDNVRQRLEHVVSALRIDASRHHPEATVALNRIQSAQLIATSDILKQECRRIDAALRLVGAEAAGLVDLVHGIYGGVDGSSVLLDLQANLAEATGLLRQCEAARQAVDAVVERLTSLLDRFEATMARLTKTVSDIVLIGINAGLKASQLGGEGRSLVVVAQQLKGTADEIARDARQLTPLFSVMIADAAPLRERNNQSERLAALEMGITEAMDVIRSASDHMNAILTRVETETSQCLRRVESARADFAAMTRRADRLTTIAHELPKKPSDEDVDASDAAGIRTFLTGELRSRYTMAAEREIFDRVLEGLGFSYEAPVVLPVDDGLTLFA